MESKSLDAQTSFANTFQLDLELMQLMLKTRTWQKNELAAA